MTISFLPCTLRLRIPALATLAGVLLAAGSHAQTPVSYTMPIPTEPMNGSILFAALIGPADGYAVSVSVHAEFIPGGSFTADDLQIVLSAPTEPNFPHWVLQGGPDFGWGTGSGTQTGDALTLTLNGEIQGLPGASVWNVEFEPLPGSGHNGVTGQFTSGAYFQVNYLPLGQGPGVGYCFGNSCPCGNDDPNAGCANSNGTGALLSATGLASLSLDDLGFVASGLPPTAPALLIQGSQSANGGAGIPLGDGLRCVGGTLVRLGVRTAAAGVASWGPGLSSAGGWSAGQTLKFQTWYRNPSGPCGSGYNLSNALSVVIIP